MKNYHTRVCICLLYKGNYLFNMLFVVLNLHNSIFSFVHILKNGPSPTIYFEKKYIAFKIKFKLDVFLSKIMKHRLKKGGGLKLVLLSLIISWYSKLLHRLTLFQQKSIFKCYHQWFSNILLLYKLKSNM